MIGVRRARSAPESAPHCYRAIAVSDPRPASTVILVRQVDPEPATRSDYEVFMVRRPVKSEFAADVFVFPGGTLRPDDLERSAEEACAPFSAVQAVLELKARGGVVPTDSHLSLGHYVAALRELFEEAGVLLAEPRRQFDPTALLPGLGAARADLQVGRISLAALAHERGLRLAPERLIYCSHWTTPAEFPRRYDTRFFLACIPPLQRALHCAVETVASAWIRPHLALERWRAGEFPLVFVTDRHLTRLAEFPRLAELLEFARCKPIVSVQPELDLQSQQPYLPAGLEGRW
jgi:8-oxo-dGTP pyrophosphatase MutT (NUDIX family)